MSDDHSKSHKTGAGHAPPDPQDLGDPVTSATDSTSPVAMEPPTALVLGRYQGATAHAPYPLSRMAPAFELVDIAREIEKADAQIATVTTGKLKVVADQIRALQDQAKALLVQAEHDARLHRARCSFEKRPGGVYHLYRNDDETLWFSLIAPNEWRNSTPQFVGTYRLEADMSFTPEEEFTERAAEAAGLRKLLR